MKPTFPGVTRSPWYSRDLIVTLIGGFPPLIGASIGAWTAWNENKPKLAALLTVSAVWLAIATLLKLLQSHPKDRQQINVESPADLTGCLHILYDILKMRCQIGDTAADKQKLRITVHRVEEDEYQQCIPYVGGDGGPPGRSTSIHAGIVGRVARTGKVLVAQRENVDHGKFLDELMSSWAFKRDEAEHIAHDRNAWMAFPIPGEKDSKPLAVLFLDSNDANFFTEEVQAIVAAAASGLASYIKVRRAS